jgi:hypothetical protein
VKAPATRPHPSTSSIAAATKPAESLKYLYILTISVVNAEITQCIIKYAIEPAHEATFHERSYGFHPGRSTHDAQKFLFDNLMVGLTGSLIHILRLIVYFVPSSFFFFPIY